MPGFDKIGWSQDNYIAIQILPFHQVVERYKRAIKLALFGVILHLQYI